LAFHLALSSLDCLPFGAAFAGIARYGLYENVVFRKIGHRCENMNPLLSQCRPSPGAGS